MVRSSPPPLPRVTYRIGLALVWRARLQPLITARGRGREREMSSKYCQFHTSARPMKSPATEMTPPVIGPSRSAGV